jgi:hypothetical protein
MTLDNKQASFLEPSISRITKQFVVDGPLRVTTEGAVELNPQPAPTRERRVV